jgi:outer membrane lipoprotein-sorting protein
MSIRLAALALMSVLLASCAPKRAEILLDTHAVPAGRLISLVAARQAALSTLTGRGVASFESPEMGGTAAFTMALRKPDSLLVRFEGPFGIDVGTLFLSRDKFVVYNSIENSVITGDPTAGTLRSVIPFDLTYDEILSAFAGAFSIGRDTTGLQRYLVDDGAFVLSFDRGTRTDEYRVDPLSLVVIGYRMLDRSGRTIMEAKASRVLEEDRVAAPRRITIVFPDEGRSVTVTYSAMTLNASDPSFAYSIPPSARIIQR